jgi:tetratricopeptide (TPR) repeat protein/DNA-binding CsgD family transcriptional regulator
MAQQQQLDEARELLRTGRYEAALACLAGHEGWPSPQLERALLLRAEILLRRDPVDALEALARSSDLLRNNAGAKHDYYVLSGLAYASITNFDGAREMFALAESAAEKDPVLLATLALQRSRLRYLQGDFDPADPDLATALAHPDPGWRARTLLVRGWMYAGQGNYRAQITDLRAAVKLARENPGQMDYHATARVVQSLLRVASDLGDAEACDEARDLYESLEWPPEMADAQFLCLRAMAWDAFMRGDSARARWLFRDAKEIAPTDAWRVWSHVDRADVARMNRNEPWARDELLQAQAQARDVVWATTNGEERQGLVKLAVLFAPVDMGQAQRYVSTYMRLGTEAVDPALAYTHDRRTAGYAHYASACVNQVLGNRESAIASFEAAYTIFDEAEHHFRAALAAQGLAEITGAAVWIERARTHAGAFPKSAFYKFMTERISRKATPWIEGLTPMQRQLALSVCEGLDMTQLSRRFSRSEFTIKREVQGLYDMFNVRSRNDLRDKLEERGVL